MKLVKENLTEKEFFDMQEDIECNFEDKTYWSNPIELAYSNGLQVIYCYDEEDKEENRIYINYKEKVLNDGTRLFDIYE